MDSEPKNERIRTQTKFNSSVTNVTLNVTKVSPIKNQFKTKKSLKNNKRKKNKDLNEKIKCKSFVTKWKLQYHMNRHKGLKPYRCDWPDCDNAYADCNALSLHKKKHIREEVYECPTKGCHFKCHQWLQLKRHEKKNHSTL